MSLYKEIQTIPGLLEYSTKESCNVASTDNQQDEYIIATPAVIDKDSTEDPTRENSDEQVEPGITIRGEGEGIVGVQVLDFEISQEMKDEVDDKLVSEQGTPKSINDKCERCGKSNSNTMRMPG